MVKEVANVALSTEPWILESFDQLAVVRRLERGFPLNLTKYPIAAAEVDDRLACNRAVFRLYGLSDQKLAALGSNGE